MVMKVRTHKRRSFSVIGLCITGLLLMLMSLTGCDQAAVINTAPKKTDVLLKAGDGTITYGEFQVALKRLMPAENEEQGEGVSSEELKELKRSLLNQLIEEHLILQEAKKAGIRVSEEELTEETKALKEGLEDEKFTEAIISRYGAMEVWQTELKKKLIIKKTVDMIVNSTVEVTAQEAQKYYNENKKDYAVPEQVHAMMIVVATEEEAKKARKLVFSGKFEDVAKEFSTGPEASSGGDLGFFGKGDMPLEFEETVFSLPLGRISKIKKSPYGYHIFKVVERTKGRKPTFKDVQEKITEKLLRERSEQLYRNWVTTLKINAKIGEINMEKIEKELLKA